jgi:hypothetical protein
MTAPDFQALYTAWVQADRAWTAEIEKAFPKAWPGDVRYTRKGRGEPGTALHAAHAALDRAHIAFVSAGGNDWLMGRFGQRAAS